MFATWTFLTNHMHVLLCIVRDPDIRLRDLAAKVGITERAAQRIVTDLVKEGYLERSRVGRRNQYVVHAELPLRHPVEHAHRLRDLLVVLASPAVEVRDIRAGQRSA
jgi:predicted transcriptional regulator